MHGNSTLPHVMAQTTPPQANLNQPYPHTDSPSPAPRPPHLPLRRVDTPGTRPHRYFRTRACIAGVPGGLLSSAPNTPNPSALLPSLLPYVVNTLVSAAVATTPPMPTPDTSLCLHAEPYSFPEGGARIDHRPSPTPLGNPSTNTDGYRRSITRVRHLERESAGDRSLQSSRLRQLRLGRR
jgi:hypothetical protein